MKATKFSTRYMKGEDYNLPYDADVWALSPHKRDEWARKTLRDNKKRPKENCFLHIKWSMGQPAGFILTNFNYVHE